MIKGVTVERNSAVTAKSVRYGSQRRELRELSVEDLLQWAYATEKVRGTPSYGIGAAAGGVGCSVGGGGVGSGCHGDALVVDRVVERLSHKAAQLVRDHAIARTRPDWKPNARHRFEPLWPDPESKPAAGSLFPVLGVATFTHPENCRCGGFAHLCAIRVVKWGLGEKGWPYCPAVERDRPQDVQAHRETFYVPWVSYLRVVRDELRRQAVDGLAAHVVSGALPPLTPWLDKIPLGKICLTGK